MAKIRILILLYLLGTSNAFADKKEGREFVDLPDVDNGYNIHVMYVLPIDGIDKEYDLNSKIGMLVYQMDKWFNNKTKGRLFEEGQKLKFDRKEDNRLDITFLRLDIEDIDISKRGINAVNVLQPAIARFGFNDPKKVYFIVYGGTNKDVCASSQLPGHVPLGVTANTAAVYIPGKRSGSCIENNGGFKPEFNNTTRSSLHEVLHILGAVPKCAPDHLIFEDAGTINDGIGGHLEIPGDIMYSVQSNVTYDKAKHLDFKSSNYYNHDNEGCLDIAKSVYVTPTVENPQLTTYGVE
tara:strand:- start:52 stop:936 length:885 start_codon:yes stop_codon:yes gene_type:complete